MVWAIMKHKKNSITFSIYKMLIVLLEYLCCNIKHNHHTTTFSNVLKGKQTLKGNTILPSFVMHS